MDLKGKTPRDVQAGVRMRVWYEEEQDNGTMSRVTYAGRSTQFSRTQGVRVWFDGFPADEQEWINEGDEWEWEDAAPAALQGPFDAVRLRLRGVEQEVRVAAGAAAGSDPSGGSLSSGLSNPNADQSPRKFNKKARMLQAGGDLGGESEPQSPSLLAPPPDASPPAPPLDVTKRPAAPADPLVKRAPARQPKQSGRRSALVAAAYDGSNGCSTATVATATAKKRPHDEEHSIRMRRGVSGTALYVPSVAAAVLAGILPLVAPPPPPSEADKYGMCRHSGLVAKYRDPQTGERYGSVEALRKLRAEAEAKASAASTGAAAATPQEVMTPVTTVVGASTAAEAG
eukprot:scaffold6991_cov95-Isochrysis_galbana.AAC.2